MQVELHQLFWVLPTDSDVTEFLLGRIGWALDCFPLLFTGILVASLLIVDRKVLTGSESDSSNIKMFIPLHGVVRGLCSWLASFRQLTSMVFHFMANKVVTSRSLKSSFYMPMYYYHLQDITGVVAVQEHHLRSGCCLGACSSGIESQFKATTLV